MPRTRNPYPAEFRDQMVALVRTGRSVESLAREYEPCAATIHEWVRQAAADDGDDPSSLTSEERDELRQLRREVRQLRQERRYPLKGRGLVCTKQRDIAEVFEFMTANQAEYSVQMMSRTLGVSRSGFYAYHSRLPSVRQVADERLSKRIAAIHKASKETYGAPRIHAELADEGIQVGRKGADRLPWLAERLRWLVWHGKTDKALDGIQHLVYRAAALQDLGRSEVRTSISRIRKRCKVLYCYIENNAHSIPDYGSRHRAGLPVSTSRAEGCVDDLANARMGKKRRMRWSPRGAHRVAITRAAVLDGRLQISHRKTAA